MLLPVNLNFNNKYFFVNFLRFVFSHHSFILFFNILKHSNSYFSSISMLRFTSSLKSCILNSKILRNVIKNKAKLVLLPGTYLILYTNNLSDVIKFLNKGKANFINFVPFAFLFKNYFISLDTSSLENFLMWEKKAHIMLTAFMLFYINFIVICHFFFIFSSLFSLDASSVHLLIKA